MGDDQHEGGRIDCFTMRLELSSGGSSEDTYEENTPADSKNAKASDTTTTTTTSTSQAQALSLAQRIRKHVAAFLQKNSFVLLILLAILLAYAYPPLGGVYLAPAITAGWICVILIFLLTGLTLPTADLQCAVHQYKFNAFVQLFNFFVPSSISYGITRLLIAVGALSQVLGDGITICFSLPMTVIMAVVLTKTASGCEASAVLNSVLGNVVGVFLSPLLIHGYLGMGMSDMGSVMEGIDLGNVFLRLTLRVILPTIAGQLLKRYGGRKLSAFVDVRKKILKDLQVYLLVYIIYTTFCTRFNSNDSMEVGASMIATMVGIQFGFLVLYVLLAWYSLCFLFRDQPHLIVMGLFGCTHKTVILGIPLIAALFPDNPDVGLYTLPILVYHPLELIGGGALAPFLATFVEREQKRLVEEKMMMREEEGERSDENDEEAVLSE
jgi:sodium/bile acid cotransporter 7